LFNLNQKEEGEKEMIEFEEVHLKELETKPLLLVDLKFEVFVCLVSIFFKKKKDKKK
jgi:hypothetical protein